MLDIEIYEKIRICYSRHALPADIGYIQVDALPLYPWVYDMIALYDTDGTIRDGTHRNVMYIWLVVCLIHFSMHKLWSFKLTRCPYCCKIFNYGIYLWWLLITTFDYLLNVILFTLIRVTSFSLSVIAYSSLSVSVIKKNKSLRTKN